MIFLTVIFVATICVFKTRNQTDKFVKFMYFILKGLFSLMKALFTLMKPLFTFYSETLYLYYLFKVGEKEYDHIIKSLQNI